MLYTSQSLPFSQISLDDWQLIKVSGADNQKFLQGQITADITHLNETHYQFSAHCDPKGKVWSNMLLFKRGEDIYYILRKSIAETQLNALKKFAVFSKVTIELEESLKLVGLAGQGEGSQQIDVFAHFSEDQNCITQDNITYLKLDRPDSRYIIIANDSDMTSLKLADETKLTSDQWALLDLQAGYAIIDEVNANQFLPQAFNLQNLDALSFDKGCYCGQEMVARAQYRGINKRGLFLLTGKCDTMPIIGDSLEQKMGENWRETGRILAAIKLDDNILYVQAILNNDLEDEVVFRVKNNPASALTINS